MSASGRATDQDGVTPAWVTGTGAVSTLGRGAARLWEGLLAGERGSRASGELGLLADGQPPWLARVDGAAAARELAWDAALEAALQAELLTLDGAGAAGSLRVLPERVAVVVGSTLADWHVHLDGHPGPALRGGLGFTPEALATSLATRLGVKGPVRAVASACASGSAAIGVGAQLLARGEADVVIAGGVDRISAFVVAGFASLRALAPGPMRPFDRRRAGLNLGEGAAFLVLERPVPGSARPVRRMLARLAGAGLSADAFHPTAPARDGAGAARAMSAALRQASLDPAAVDLVIAHGTGTPYNDPMEARALERVLGMERAHQVTVTSTKASLGHTLGAAAAFDAVTAVLALGQGRVPPLASADDLEVDPEIPLTLASARTDASPSAVLCTASGFGGTNSALVFIPA